MTPPRKRRKATQSAPAATRVKAGKSTHTLWGGRFATELAQSLEQGVADPAVLERQQRLFRRMLDAGRALENDQTDESSRRESRPGDQSNPFVPPNAPASGKAALKYRVPEWNELRGLSPEERRLVIEYFRRLNGDKP